MLVQVHPMSTQNPYLLNKLTSILVVTSFIVISSCNNNKTNLETLNLEWFDDFNGVSLDTNFWNVEYGNGCPDLCGFGNNEAQTYTASNHNLRIENGKLILRATFDSIFKSVKLTTGNHVDFNTGIVEVSAKLPNSRGCWPAIWLLPTLERPLNWPLDGEIDIMENVGYFPNYVYGTIHTSTYNHLKGTQLSDSVFITNPHDSFHTYKLVWTDSTLEWLVDDIRFHFLEKSSSDGVEEWPFNEPFHLIINLAVGGNWGGKEGIDTLSFPQNFEIDYVKIKSPSVMKGFKYL